MAKGNFEYNYPRVIEYLKKNEILYEEFAGGQHLRIWGGVRMVDLWPSRMKYHIIDSEEAIPSMYQGYKSLSYYFEEKDLETLLNEELK